MTFYMGGQRRQGYVPGRDSMVDEVMRGWQNKYCSFSDSLICISTFNVNGKSPPPSIRGWFADGKVADFYAVGLQEMDLSVGTYLIDNPKKMEEWLVCIQNSLPGGPNNYTVISSTRLVGIFVVLLQSRVSSVKVSEIRCNYIATGITVLVNKLGNKGGTAISLRMNDTLVCFVNCHLAAGNSELDRRNQDFRDISQLQFGNSLTIYDHDFVFWFGDLNYRINADVAGWSGDQVRQLASSSEFHRLFKYDQLREQQSFGRVFVGFREPDQLSFRPTYKYDPGTNQWDSSEKARAPAWCDRILYWMRENDAKMEQQTYESVNEVSVSDHKPVRSAFKLVLRSMDQKKADKLHDAAIREADRRANELLPQITLSQREVDFGEVRFLEPYCQLITITNTGKSQVRFKFMPRKERSISSRWLQVTPPHYAIPVGQSTQISLTVVIDKEIAWDLAETDLQDILVMSLENGRDYFIPVVAKYYPRCFGVTLERLLSNKGTKTANLIDFGEETSDADQSPQHVPREIYRLVSALQSLGVHKLDLVDGVINNSSFIRIRNTLEDDSPKDLTKLGVDSASIYNALLRLLDSLKSPLIPPSRQDEIKRSCHESGRLWALVSSLPPINSAVLEYLIGYLTEVMRSKTSADDLLSVWADVLFRDGFRPTVPPALRPSPLLTDARAIALRSLCAYDKAVAIFHSQSTPRMAP